MARILATAGRIVATMSKALNVKPDPEELQELGSFFTIMLRGYADDRKISPVKTAMEMEKREEITLEQFRKLQWLAAHLFEKEWSVEPHDNNFWKTVRIGSSNQIDDFTALCHFAMGFSKRIFSVNHAKQNGSKATKDKEQLERFQTQIVGDAIGKITDDQYARLMARYEYYGLKGLIDDVIQNPDQAYVQPNLLLKKHKAWKRRTSPTADSAVEGLKVKENESPATKKMDGIAPTPSQPRHSIADKQAFFDGVDFKDFLKFHLATMKSTKDDSVPYFKEINTAMERVGKKIRIKTGLETIKKFDNDEMRNAYGIVMISKTTMRGFDATVKYNQRHAAYETRLESEHEELGYAYSHEGTRELLFNLAHDNNFLPELYFLINAKDSILSSELPKKVTDHLIDWCEKKGIDLDQILFDYDLPAMDDLDAIIAKGYEARNGKGEIDLAPPMPPEEDAPSIAESPISKIERVMVPDLLPDGENNDGVPDLVDVFTQKQDPRTVAERELELRPDWFREALENDPNVDHAKCREFYNPMETTDVSGRYYTVFHVVMLDGNTTQYAISRCKGQVSYILKADHGLMVDPDTRQSLMDIPALRRERMVQTRRCRTKDGYKRDLMELGYRNSADVSEQTKTSTRWKGVTYRADQIFNSMTAYHSAMGKPPTAHSGIIVHGDLGTKLITTPKGDLIEVYKSLAEADTRWDLVDKAFRAGLIVGFEEVKSLGAFWNMFNEDTPTIKPQKLTV